MTKDSSIDAKTLRVLLQRIGQTAGPTFHVSVPSGILELLIQAYIERGALIVVNHEMETQGAEIAPYWAHHMLVNVLRKWDCSNGPDTCRTSSKCVTEYCHSCYSKVWWESQHSHKAQAKRKKK